MLSSLDKYNKFFGVYNSNNYHPNELSASLFENIIYNRFFNINTPNISIAYDKMIKFLKNYYFKK